MGEKPHWDYFTQEKLESGSIYQLMPENLRNINIYFEVFSVITIPLDRNR